MNEYRVEGETAILLLQAGVREVECLVDLDDLHLIRSHRRWSLMEGKSTEYAVRRIWTGRGNPQHTEYMHRLIMQPPAGMVVDHRNGNGLDNRRQNLRVCTHSENLRNRSVQSDRPLRRGVSQQANGRFYAYFALSFDTYEEAVAQREEWEQIHHGEFASFNGVDLMKVAGWRPKANG